MKIYADTELLYEVTELDKKALEARINKENLNQVLKQNVQWAIQSTCDQAFEGIKKDWLAILFTRYPSIPTGKKELLDLILSQPDYRDQFMKENKIQTLETQKFVVS
jgi:hypothetical protein